jgi:hypothetical protein
MTNKMEPYTCVTNVYGIDDQFSHYKKYTVLMARMTEIPRQNHESCSTNLYGSNVR